MPEIETWLRWQGHRRCLGKLLTGLNDGEKPTIISTDKAPAYIAALAELKAAYATIKVFEVMRAAQGQAAAFNLTCDIRGGARIVERAFGLGASALAEAVRHVSEQLEREAA